MAGLKVGSGESRDRAQMMKGLLYSVQGTLTNMISHCSLNSPLGYLGQVFFCLHFIEEKAERLI